MSSEELREWDALHGWRESAKDEEPEPEPRIKHCDLSQCKACRRHDVLHWGRYDYDTCNGQVVGYMYGYKCKEYDRRAS